MQLQVQPDACIASVATAFPEHVVDRADAAATLARLFPNEDRSSIDALVERSGVETRHIVPSLDEVLAGPGFTRRNERYRGAAADLAESACRAALDRARLTPRDVDVIIDVSCTGIVIPALDVALAPRLGLRADVRRIPITESGCAAGALALGLASPLAARGARVLVVAVELCSLSLVPGDRSRTNLIASVLFGDGAAAAIVTANGGGPRIRAVGSHLVPNSEDAMGFDVGDHGLRIVLQRELPDVLARSLPAALDGFLEKNGRNRADIGLHLLHPGGRRILEAYSQIAALAHDDLRYSRAALRRYGNLSSASVLAVLDLALLDGFPLARGKDALMLAVGPGLSLEMLLLANEER